MNTNTEHGTGFEPAFVGCQARVWDPARPGERLRGSFSREAAPRLPWFQGCCWQLLLQSSKLDRLRDGGLLGGDSKGNEGLLRCRRVQRGERMNSELTFLWGLGHSINNPSFVLRSCLMARLRFAGRLSFRWGVPRDIIRRGQESALSDLMLITSLCKGRQRPWLGVKWRGF